MTDLSQPSRASLRDVVAAKIKRRYAAEKRFRAFGVAMVTIAILACGLLIASILGQSIPALTENRLHLNVNVTGEKADPAGRGNPLEIREQGNFYGLVQDSLMASFPAAEADGTLDDLFDVATSLAAVPIGKTIAANPQLIGKKLDVSLPINDDLDLFLKGAFGKTREIKGQGNLVAALQPDGTYLLSGTGDLFRGAVSTIQADLAVKATALEQNLDMKQQRLSSGKSQVTALTARLTAAKASGVGVPAAEAFLDQAVSNVAGIEAEINADKSNIVAFREAARGVGGALPLTSSKPSVFVETASGTYQLTSLTPTLATAQLLVRPSATQTNQSWTMVQIATPQDGRSVSDKTIAYGRQLKSMGLIRPALNATIFTNSDSNEPELSGLLSAFVGSLLTLAVTLCLAVPIGVATAVYLEEFAPKNWITDFIEVNINNLAAVPSIVFGLLGFAVFLTFFNMPRSAPIVGGIVLALMSLPVIIIASRAALKAVPPSIREAALGVGASKMQATFHHVLPLAMPGIMTGSILAMAHALGETAPLLMIGMVAFIADVPTGLTDSATVLPVELFMWAGRPERAWEPRTALAIILLLVFMILMNGLAIYLRRKFERRW
jgi:phosphate transport system permease protein